MTQTWHSILEYLAHGMLAWRPWQIVAYTAATTHLTIGAVTVYLHRCQAHRALALHPAVSHVFRFWLWIATGMATREWVALIASITPAASGKAIRTARDCSASAGCCCGAPGCTGTRRATPGPCGAMATARPPPA